MQTIIETIAAYQPVEMALTPRAAAVMVILLADEHKQLEIILTKRAASLPYAGDYSFPGGMYEDNDIDLYTTAARELMEELNIASDAYKRIGQLDDFNDRFGNLVRPYVILMNKNDFQACYKQSDAEIETVYYFPVSRLRDIKDDPDLYVITRRRPSYSYTDNEVFVWGLTAAILVHLSNIIYQENKSLGKEIK